jgi:hypothetical protein
MPDTFLIPSRLQTRLSPVQDFCLCFLPYHPWLYLMGMGQGLYPV